MGLEANKQTKSVGASPLSEGTPNFSPVSGLESKKSPPSSSAYSDKDKGISNLQGGAWKSSFGFDQLFSKINPLDVEIDRLTATLKVVSGPAADEALKRLRGLQQAKKVLDAVDQISIRRKDVRSLVDEARRKITNGALQSDAVVYDGGIRLAKALWSYQDAEKYMLRVRQAATSLYPKDSPEVFRLDFTGRKEDTYGPSNEFMNKLTIKKTYDKLVESGDPEDLEIRIKVEEVFDDLRESADLYPAPSKNDAMSECSPLTIEDVELYTQELNDLYQSPELKAFFTKLQETEKEEFKGNEGYRTRMDYSEAVQSLKLIDVCLAHFDKYESEDLKGLAPEKLTAGKTFLEARMKAYKTSMVEERKRIKEQNGWANLDDQMAKGGLPGVENPALIDWQLLNSDIEKADAVLASLDKVDPKFTDATSKKQAFDALKKIATETRAVEEGHVQAALEKMIIQLKKLPSPETKLSQIETDLFRITPENVSDKEARIKAYGDIASRLQRVAVVRTVDARIKMYEEFQSELKAGDRWLDVSHTIAYGVTLGLVGPRDDYEVPGIEDVAKVLATYRLIRDQVASDNEGDRTAGLVAFTNLESAIIHKTLQGNYEKVATLNSFTIGVGIVLASALTAGVASAALAPFVGGTALGGEILFGVNVLTFSAATHVYRAPFYGTKELGKLASLDFAGELVMNAAMFKYLGKAMETYEKYFEKGLEVAARRNVAARLSTAITVTSGAGAESGMSKAVVEEMDALRKTLGIKMGKTAGSFVYEGIKFQQWDFYVTAGRLAMKGDKNPIGGALTLSTSVKSLTHSFAFLFMLKAGGALQEPLTVKMHEGMKDLLLGPEFDKYFATLNDRIEGLRSGLEHYRETGKGNPGELLKLYETSLLEQEAVLKKIPAGYRNEALVELNKALLGELYGFKTSSTLFLGLFGEGNRFGVKSSASASTYTYDPAKQSSLVSALASHAWVEPGSIVTMSGGAVRAQFINAEGKLVDVEFKPEFKPALPAKPGSIPSAYGINLEF